MTPEESAAKKEKDETEAAGKKDKKAAKKEGGKKKKKGKKTKEKGGDKDQTVKIGPTEVVGKFDMFYDEFNSDWVTRDETGNHMQSYDEALARQDVRPQIKEEYKSIVDEMINTELVHMRLRAGVKEKKTKKSKKKSKKKKKSKGPKLPGYKGIKDMKPKEILVELIQNNIVKKIPV